MSDAAHLFNVIIVPMTPFADIMEALRANPLRRGALRKYLAVLRKLRSMRTRPFKKAIQTFENENGKYFVSVSREFAIYFLLSDRDIYPIGVSFFDGSS